MKLAAPALIVLLLFLIPGSSDAQWLEQIQTESDWDYLYQDGFYDDISFQLYRDMTEGITPGDTTEYIIGVQGNSISELSAWPPKIENTADTIIQSILLLSQKPAFFFRSGQRLDDGKTSAYYLGNVDWKNISLQYKGRNSNSAWTTERRAAHLRYDKFGLTLGNFTASIGEGLGIGRYDFRPVTGNSESSDNLLYPQNSYYNGARISYDNSTTLIVSQKKYGSLKKGFLGCSISGRTGEFSLGITGSVSRLSDAKQQTLGAASIYMANSALGISGEAGYGESGAGMVMKMKRGGFDIRLWHYDPGFINLNSSSSAHPDYIIYSADSSGIGFRQVQRGESGLLIRKTIAIGRAIVAGGSEIWKKTPHSSIATDISLSGRIYLGRNISFGAGFWDRQGTASARSLSQLGLYYQGRCTISSLISLWVSDGLISQSQSFGQLYCHFAVNCYFILSGRIRQKFNSKYECFIEEKTILGEHFSLKGTYRIQNDRQNEIGPLYIVMEGSF